MEKLHYGIMSFILLYLRIEIRLKLEIYVIAIITYTHQILFTYRTYILLIYDLLYKSIDVLINVSKPFSNQFYFNCYNINN